jgi:nitrogen regulatory protein PII
MNMKKVTTYVNTIRVHWLVEELEGAGIKEIMVTEYFSPLSKISRLELACEDDKVETVRSIVHRIGTTGAPGDHLFVVTDFDPDTPSKLPVDRRMSRLEE